MGLTQPLIEMSTMNLAGSRAWRARKVDNLTAVCEPIVQKMWEPRSLTTLRSLTVSYKDSFTFYLLYTYTSLYGIVMCVSYGTTLQVFQ
jgi:hypothetical protein